MPRSPTVVCLAVCLVLTLACDAQVSTSTNSPQSDEEPARASKPIESGEIEDDGALPAPKTLDEAVSEERFKAMHELSEEKRPTPAGEMIDLGGTKAYLVLPHGEGPFPGIVVVHEWWGLNDHIKYWSDRLAQDGYATIAVDLYGGEVATTPDGAMALMKAVDEKTAQATMTAAHQFLAKDERILAPKRGVIGWCFGGGWSLRQALTVDGLDAAVIYYGRLVDDPKALAGIEASVLGVFGNEDEGIPPDAVNAFEAAMGTAKRPIEIHRFDAPHAFANPSSARYDHESATKAWERVRAFLGRELAR